MPIFPVRPSAIFDMLPEDQRHDFILPMPDRSTDSPTILELTLLMAVGRIAGAGKNGEIFEFGTFRGFTTLTLSKNFPDVLITTLDLSQARSSELLQNVPTVRRLQRHSMRFDADPLTGCMAMVFVDGGHDFETTLSDSDKAEHMLATTGAIVWHDYNEKNWAGAHRAINAHAFRVEHTGRVLLAIEDTSLAVMFNS